MVLHALQSPFALPSSTPPLVTGLFSSSAAADTSPCTQRLKITKLTLLFNDMQVHRHQAVRRFIDINFPVQVLSERLVRLQSTEAHPVRLA